MDSTECGRLCKLNLWFFIHPVWSSSLRVHFSICYHLWQHDLCLFYLGSGLQKWHRRDYSSQTQEYAWKFRCCQSWVVVPGTRIPHRFNSVQLLSRVWLFVTPWIAARQASLSITNSRSSLKLTSIKSVMPSNHLILCCPPLLLPSIFPSIRIFSSESTLRMRWGVSALVSVLPKNTQDWSPLEWTGWISL